MADDARTLHFAQSTAHPAVTAAYDAALDTYFLAARADETVALSAGSDDELVAAARAAADRARAAVPDDRAAWAVCREDAVQPGAAE